VCDDDLAGNEEAEAVGRGAVLGPGLKEAGEDFRLVGGGDTDAVILDLDLGG